MTSHFDLRLAIALGSIFAACACSDLGSGATDDTGSGSAGVGANGGGGSGGGANGGTSAAGTAAGGSGGTSGGGGAAGTGNAPAIGGAAGVGGNGGTGANGGGGQSVSGGDGASGGTSGSGGNGGSGGVSGSGGNGGTGGASGSGGTGGASGSGGTGGASGSGGTGGASGSGGASGGTGGASGSGGASGGSGGTGGTGGAGGTGGSGGDGDRCDIANYDAGDPPQALTLSGNLGTHDPMIIAAHGQYYLFSTGNNIGAKTSSNLMSWQGVPDVFTNSSRPAWLSQQVPGVSNLWAPDASYFGGSYHLYYSASTFGSNRSCIGHLTRSALNSGSWTDRGPVICSNVGSNDNWNAIDPNVIVDQSGTPWLAFGSFWSGIKLIQLDQNGARVGTSVTSIAARPSAGGALEAPFIVRRCGYYYLFVSWDRCCQGVDSTYNIRVGRSTSVTGPYVDRQGTSMLQGGGTLVLQGSTRWRGPGHNAVLFTDTAAYNIYHSYDANNNGAPTLRISELVWDSEGWPVSGGP